jgi:RNA polymerase sigma factor (TIGR02999 family)
MTDVTRILSEIEQGDPAASDKLLPLVYEELRVLARQRLAKEKPGQTLQATALVHEAYLRLVGNGRDEHWNSRGHFFGAAAEAMRRILVNRARDKKRLKRDGQRQELDFNQLQFAIDSPSEDLIDLSDAISQLEDHDKVCAELVKLRFFAGLRQREAADCLGLTKSTADRYWAYARTWLYDRLRGSDIES